MSMPPKKLKKFNKEISKKRVKYDNESEYPWLVDLLDSYHIIDAGVRIELDAAVKVSGNNIACKEGCFACCLNSDVRINSIELQGLHWYVSEVMSEEVYEVVSSQLEEHLSTNACPFLVEGRCSVYPVRPIACRIMYVANESCEIEEDVYASRPDDIFYPHKPEVSWMVSKRLMPHMGINDELRQFELFQSGFMLKNTKSMHTLDWKVLSETTKQIRNLK